MKKICALFLLHFVSILGFSQYTWTWLQGDAFTSGYSHYGQQGAPDAVSNPGRRIGQVSWLDKNGDYWLFGGSDYNDIWKYSVQTRQWTWVNGSKYPVATGAVYGTQGVPSSSNIITSRNYASSWIDDFGDLWVFGGRGPSIWYSNVSINQATNDLWKYSTSTNQWTWMGGDTVGRTPSLSVQGNFGKKGISTATNKPPSKHHAMNWVDRQGNFWLFAGTRAGLVEATLTNDLWKYLPSSELWTWMSGDTLESSPMNAVFGVKGVESELNTPGKRIFGTTWTDSSGNLWLFGGYGAPESTIRSAGSLSDLWRFSPASGMWSWMGGDTIPNATGKYMSQEAWPASRREATGWTDKQGDLWLRSGSTVINSTVQSYFDIWRYSVSANKWTWLGGDSIPRTYVAVPVDKNVPLTGINPPPDPAKVGSENDDNLLFFLRGDQSWRYTLSTGQWTFLSGQPVREPTPFENINETIGLSDSADKPLTRVFASTWKDKTNNFWMFGGRRTPNEGGIANLFDLWKYNPATKTWTFLGGSEGVASLQFGTLGQASDSARPSDRYGAFSSVGESGIFWLFGGSTSTTSQLNDLWTYSSSTSQWTWWGGYQGSSNYGTYGVPSAASWPAGRGQGVSWTDRSGRFWIFGGKSGSDIKNELWMFDPQIRQWTFYGGNTPVVPGYTPTAPETVYGIKGVPGTNGPGGRLGSASWIDTSGNFWLFGGGSYNSSYGNQPFAVRESFNNDLWKFSPVAKQWTWVSGDNFKNSKGRYSNKGVASANSAPRARKDASAWSDGLGNLFLLGGSRDTIDSRFTEYYNDLWKYSIATDQWTWLGGDSVANRNGNYGIFGVSSPGTEPGSRTGVATWGDGAGNAWIFSGYGFPQSGKRALNDMMMFSTVQSPLPARLKNLTAMRQTASVSLQWITAQEENTRAFEIERSSDGFSFSTIGRVTAAGNSQMPTRYSYIDNKPYHGNNYYRLKILDIDNSISYSRIVNVDFAERKSSFVILSNPVRNNLDISADLLSSEMLQLKVMDLSGKVLMSRNYLGAKGTNLIQLPVSRLTQGDYILHVNSKSLSIGKTFSKL